MSGALLHGFGLTMASDLPIPGAVAAGSGAAPDLTIARTADAESASELWQKQGDALVYAPAGAGTFRCTSNRIDVHLRADADPSLAAELLVANALPAVLWQRGRFVLHAAAVVLPGMARAIALAGASGSGKSSLARALVANGARLVGDDSIALDGGVASGLSGGTFGAIQADRTREFQAVSPDHQALSAPLAAIVVLGAPGAASEPARADSARAVELVLAQRHRQGIATLLGRRREAFEAAVAIARAVPVLTWTRRAGAMDLEADEIDALASLVRD